MVYLLGGHARVAQVYGDCLEHGGGQSQVEHSVSRTLSRLVLLQRLVQHLEVLPIVIASLEVKVELPEFIVPLLLFWPYLKIHYWDFKLLIFLKMVCGQLSRYM